VAGDVDPLTSAHPKLIHVLRVEQDHAPAVVDATVAIIQAVDRRIELIMAAYCRHQQLAWSERMLRNGAD
jgi:hypothetical protein